jgi:L-asparaginase II
MNPVLVELWRSDASVGANASVAQAGGDDGAVAGAVAGTGAACAAGAVESRHRGALAVVDADGRCVLALGDVDRPVFGRSAVKGLQALPLVASGAAEAYGLNDAELALACASHGGEPAHVATAAGLLTKLGLDVSALECGAHAPMFGDSASALVREGRPFTALENNCSGKHAGFVCLGCLLARQAGSDAREFIRGYVEPNHPVMREVAAALSAATGVDVEHAPRGRDGCSIPTYALPLTSLALGFARFATGQGLSPAHAAAAARLRRAVAARPDMVAGTGRFDTRVMQALGERVFCKVGAEGVYCAALPERGWGVAIKVDDGNNARAVELVMAAVLQVALGLAGELPPDQSTAGAGATAPGTGRAGSAPAAALLASLADQPLVNWRGLPVGRLAAAGEFTRMLAPVHKA